MKGIKIAKSVLTCHDYFNSCTVCNICTGMHVHDALEGDHISLEPNEISVLHFFWEGVLY